MLVFKRYPKISGISAEKMVGADKYFRTKENPAGLTEGELSKLANLRTAYKKRDSETTEFFFSKIIGIQTDGALLDLLNTNFFHLSKNEEKEISLEWASELGKYPAGGYFNSIVRYFNFKDELLTVSCE